MARKIFRYSWVTFLIPLFLFQVIFSAEVQAQKETVSSSVDKTNHLKIDETYGKLPLYFIQNNGQVDESVKYYEKGSGHATFFTKDGVYLSLGSSKPSTPDIPSPLAGEGQGGGEAQLIKLSFLNANPKPEIIATDMQEGKVNFFKGNDSKKWKTNIPTYLGVLYKEVYKGVDVKYYGNNSQIEYDIIVKPGADPSKVAFSYDGIKGLKVLENGDLEIALNEGSIIQKKPYVYQEINGKRIEVNGRFVIPEHKLQDYSYGFEVASYNKEHNLIIDPVIVYSTYIGGNGADVGGRGIFLDSAGNVYITGDTFSTDFPLAGAYSGNGDAFITKINASGSGIVFSTYIGGSLHDLGTRLTTDSSGNIYLTGSTGSVDFPILTPLPGHGSYGGGAYDAFITKLNPSGSAIIYSAYLGGSGDDYGWGVGLDTSTGAVYVSGGTGSINFPILAAIKPVLSGTTDAFITKIDSSGSSIVFSTYWGGMGYDEAQYMAISSVGNIYITGDTTSIDFPVLYPVQPANGGLGDAFVSVIGPSGSSVVFSTYLGGSGYEYGSGIAVDSTGAAYVTGNTTSADFPLFNAVQPYFGGGTMEGDAFVTKINYGGGIAYSTYLGGTYDDSANRIVVDSAGAAYISGGTYSYDFPIANPIQGACVSCSTYQDAFITKINPAGTGLEYSTFLGGGNYDYGRSIAVDSAGNAYVSGETLSTDFPMASPIQGSCASCPTTVDTFLTKISPAEPPVSDIAISTTAANVDYTSVAFDGTNYLVVWEDYRSGVSSDIYGRFISATGTPMGSEFVISTSSYDKFYPRVSFDGINYLVVWEDYRDNAGLNSDVYGQFVSTSGVLAGGEIAIVNNPATNQSTPVISFNGTRYLIVWSDNRYGDYSIWGKFMDTSGFLYTRFAIGNVIGDQTMPEVKFDGTNFLVVWADYRSVTSDIYGQLVSNSTTGVLVENEIPISTAALDQVKPQLDHSGADYMIVWTDYRSGIRADIYAQIRTSSGTMVGTEIPLVTSNVPSRKTRWVVFNGSDRYLIIWLDRGKVIDPQINRRVKGLFVTTSGSPIGSDFDITSNAIDRNSPGLAFDGTNYLATWADNRNGSDKDAFGKIISGMASSGNTSSGTNVPVAPLPAVSLNFSSVSTAGNTTITTSSSGTPPPSGFNLGNSPTYYEIVTTAVFTGPVQVCFNYNPANFGNENLIRLFHFNGATWDDITGAGYPNTAANLICGTTTSFSPFVIAQEASTAVTLSNLSATADGDDVLLTWSTKSEADNEGFVVLRGENPNGTFSTVSSMIPAVGGLGLKAAYTFTDSNVEEGKTYYYRLQDVDSSGRVTEHKVVSVYAGDQKQEAVNQKQEGRSQKQEERSQTTDTDRKAQASQQITSVVVMESEGTTPPHPALPRKGGGDNEEAHISYPQLEGSSNEAEQLNVNSVSVKQPEKVIVASAEHSTNLKPSHFSVSLEDEKGNVVKISSPEADSISAESDFQSLKVTEESGKVILSWLGKGILKGFILQRSERGKAKFTAISGLIPYFGKNAGDRFVYEFTDKEAKTRNQFEYRLETVTSHEPLALKGE